jgi:hypothetical protein
LATPPGSSRTRNEGAEPRSKKPKEAAPVLTKPTSIGWFLPNMDEGFPGVQ